MKKEIMKKKTTLQIKQTEKEKEKKKRLGCEQKCYIPQQLT